MKHLIENQGEKISEKTFSHSILISVLSILLCIVALTSASYAWFTTSMSSSANTLQSGSFDLDIVVLKNGKNTAEQADTDGTYTLAEGTYKVTLTMTNTSNVKGYCSIIVGGESIPYHSTTMGVKSDKSDRELTLTLKVEKESAVFTFTPKWGLPAGGTILENNATLTIPTPTQTTNQTTESEGGDNNT